MKILCVITAICAVALGCYEHTLDNKIVGGEAGDIKDFPYLVSIGFKRKHYCGGSIIDNTTIVTTAGCLSDKKIKVQDLSVSAGNTNYKKGTLYTVKKVTLHEKYNKTTYENDIAILKINGNFDFKSTTKPIKLAESRSPAGTDATISGWGYDDDDELPNNFNYVVVEVISNSNCSKAYEKYEEYLKRKVTSEMMCTLSEGKDACERDTGGPLVADETLIGVVSWGLGCARGNPRVYTDVSSFSSWISEHR